MEEQLSLQVFFENPFWVGVFERRAGGQLRVCRVVFGPEPSDAEIYLFILKHFDTLRFSPAVADTARRPAANPKRLQRQARQAVAGSGLGTKAQQALQLQREQQKTQRTQTTRAQREAEAARRFMLRQQKRKEKHRGH